MQKKKRKMKPSPKKNAELPGKKMRFDSTPLKGKITH